jgi:hypothetical protein
MTTKLPKGVQLAIDEYLRCQPGLITLSDAVDFVKATAATDLPSTPIREAIAASAIAGGRSIHFDHLTHEAARQAAGR